MPAKIPCLSGRTPNKGSFHRWAFLMSETDAEMRKKQFCVSPRKPKPRETKGIPQLIWRDLVSLPAPFYLECFFALLHTSQTEALTLC